MSIEKANPLVHCTDSPPVIQLHNIVKTYTTATSTHTVLNHLSLTIKSHEWVAILGTSGSGKSTLMHILGLLDQDYSGHYWLQGACVQVLDKTQLAQQRNQTIGFVFQHFHLIPRLNVFDNVALPLRYRKNLTETTIMEQSLHALEQVGMQAFLKRMPNELSGGQQQRIAIARALVGEPDIILADEPTGALDSRTSTELMALFATLNHRGKTIVLITHQTQIASYCHRQITLHDGEIALDRHA